MAAERHASLEGTADPMRIAITGSTGMIGTALVRALRSMGHTVTRILRSASSHTRPETELLWDPVQGQIDAAGLEAHDAVVHLAGESIAGLWTQRRRAAIRESRVRGTRLLAETIASLEHPPATLLSASAVGIYGDRPDDEQVDDDAEPGTGFLAETGIAWEGATRAAEDAGIRVAHLRFGLVLSREGGLLRAMLPAFRLGLGARLGSGRQWMPWITLDDVVGAILHLLADEDVDGPVNIVAPEAVSNAEFTRALAHAVRRPAPLRAPAWVLRLLLRDQADEMLLGGARVVPRRLIDSGYTFRNPQLSAALRTVLGRTSKRVARHSRS